MMDRKNASLAEGQGLALSLGWPVWASGLVLFTFSVFAIFTSPWSSPNIPR